MPPRTLQLSAAATVLAAALLYSALGYFTGAVPFPAQQRGELRPDAVCSVLGDSDRAATELNKVLPARADYTTRETNPPRTTDDASWQSTCFVSGDGDQLLVATTELGYDGTATAWLDGPHDFIPAEEKTERFQAGAAAVVTKQTAQILVPCLPRDGGSPTHLTTVVHAYDTLVGTTAENRQALTNLALATAGTAHTHAKCSTPSQLPRKITG